MLKIAARLLELITHCLIKNVLIYTAFLWIFCESRHLLGIGTRLGAMSDGEYLHSYSTWTKGEVISGHSDFQNDHFGREQPFISLYVTIFFIFFGFFFILSCICLCVICKRRQRRLWDNIDPNPSRPAFEVYPPVNHDVRTPVEIYPPVNHEVRTPIVNNDVPPNYNAVVETNAMATNYGDGSSHYPTAIGEKSLETPPPAYSTVAHFM